MERSKAYRRFAPGERIASSGAEMHHVSTLMSGLASLSRTQERGTRQIVGLLQRGDLIGQPWRRQSSFDVEALTPVELCSFRAEVFEGFLDRMPGMQDRLMDMVLDDLDAARLWLVNLARKTARQKLAGVLVLLALRQNTAPLEGGVRCEVNMMLSREQMADLLSMSFETVSRQIAGLTRDDLIRPVTRRVFDIPDLQALMAAAGDDAEGGTYQP